MSIVINVVAGGALSGCLSEYIAAGEPAGHARVETADAQSVAGLLEQLGIAADRPLLLIVNAEVISAEARRTHALADGDKVSIASPIRAG